MVFGVGDRTFREASAAGGRPLLQMMVAALATLAWLTGVGALLVDVPNLAGAAALLISGQVTIDWWRARGRQGK